MKADARTLAVYERKAVEYSAMVIGDAADPRLSEFLADLPPGGDVLDLGCGPGHAAARMRRLGFAVTALDASARMAAMARDRYDLKVIVAGFDRLTEVDAYDGVWASFSLLHAPRAAMSLHLTAIHRALRPGGKLSLGLKTGQGEGRDTLGRFYTYYSDAEITGLLQAAGFAVTDRTFGVAMGLDGKRAPWIVLRAHA